MKIQKRNKFVWYVILIISLFVTNLLVNAQGKSSVDKEIATEKPISVDAKDVNNNMSPEEKIIRWTYKKLSVYEIVNRFSVADKKNEPKGQELADKSLKFKLSSFHSGPIEEIQNVRLKDLVTSPAGEIIQIGTGNTTRKQTNRDGTITSDETKFSVDAKWVNGQYARGMDENWSVNDILQLESVRFYDVVKYISYEVTVSLDGKKRTYLALALFHNSPEPPATLKPDFLDSVVGMGGIVNDIFRETKLPLGTKRNSDSNQNLSNSPKISKVGKAAGKREIKPNLLSACTEGWYPGCEGCLEWYVSPLFSDGWGSYCLVSEFGGGGYDSGGGGYSGCKFDLKRISMPGTPQQDTTDHTSGSHWERTDYYSDCIRDTSCNVHCSVTDETAVFGDDSDGVSGFYYHVGKTNRATEPNDGGLNQDITCKTTRGYFWKYCLFNDCSFNMSVTIAGAISVSPSGDEVWSTQDSRSRVCRMSR